MDLTGFDRSTRISSRSVLIHGKLWIPHPCKGYYDELIKSTVNMHPLVANYVDIDHDWRSTTSTLSHSASVSYSYCNNLNLNSYKRQNSSIVIGSKLWTALVQAPNYSYFFRDRLWARTITTNVHFKNRNRHKANLPCIVIDAWYQYQMSVPGSECMVRYENLKVPMEVVPRTVHRVMGTDKFWYRLNH